MKIGEHTSMKLSFGFVQDLWFALTSEQNKTLKDAEYVTKPEIRIGIPQIEYAIYDGCNSCAG